MQKNKGFTFIETLVAVTLLFAAVVGPLAIASQSLRGSVFAQNQITAFMLAQEGVEYVRYVRDTNSLRSDPWLNELQNCSNATPCFIDNILTDVEDAGVVVGNCGATCNPVRLDPATGLFGNTGDDTIFTREIRIDDTTFGANEAEIEVTVNWNNAGQARSVVVKDQIYNWTGF